jgi:hypothetical protein
MYALTANPPSIRKTVTLTANLRKKLEDHQTESHSEYRIAYVFPPLHPQQKDQPWLRGILGDGGLVPASP